MVEQIKHDDREPAASQHGFKIDIAANRRASKWTSAELIGRTLWAMTRPLFLLSPRPFWGWRNFLLKLFGARIGRHVHIFPTVRIAIPWNLSVGDDAAIGDGAILYSLGLIHIGPAVTISQYGHICAGTHDYRRPELPLMKPPISIEEGAWICADAFVGPNVTVSAFAIVGARAVVTRDVAAGTIVAGNPARMISTRPPFLNAQ
jgi:putative colanic acid biosynthesis acetyltransferase WcaF